MDKKALVGLSGGVDSSVAAALLRRQGYDLVGVTLWLMKGKGQCCSEGMVDAAFICEQLGIPHQIVDSREVFQAEILDYVVSSYAEGITPLPCSQCNRAVKFGPMLRYGRDTLGIERLATGHYAKVGQDQATRRWQLRRALDRHKDQSYFLYDLSQEVLSQVLFPLGELTKTQTRQIAQELGLKTADKPESQDLCLVEAHGDLRTFLEQYLAPKPGEIVDLEGRVLGRHEGIHHYTIGQRKGLGVSAPEPLYVVKLDPVRNQVIVGNRDSAGGEDCWVSRLNWVSIPEPRQPLTCEVQVRYRSAPVAVLAIPAEDGRLQLRFAEPQFGIAPGQAAVLYQGDILLGGGIIERPQNLSVAGTVGQNSPAETGAGEFDHEPFPGPNLSAG